MTHVAAIAQDSALALADHASALAIESQIDYEAAAALLRQLAQMADTIRASFGPHIKAAHESHRALLATQSEHLAPVLLADRTLRERMANYMAFVRAEKHELRALAAQTGAELVLDPSDSAGVSLVETWDIEITDESLIPREYLAPNLVQLRALARKSGGTARVPGVRMVPKSSVRVRK